MRYNNKNVNDKIMTKDGSVANEGTYPINGIRVVDNNIKLINNSFVRVYHRPDDYIGFLQFKDNKHPGIVFETKITYSTLKKVYNNLDKYCVKVVSRPDKFNQCLVLKGVLNEN